MIAAAAEHHAAAVQGVNWGIAAFAFLMLWVVVQISYRFVPGETAPLRSLRPARRARSRPR